MQPKINVQKALFGFLAEIGTVVVFEKLFETTFPKLSWGSDMCKICDRYECTTYNDLCDYCAEDVREELNNDDEDLCEQLNYEDENNNGAEG